MKRKSTVFVVVLLLVACLALPATSSARGRGGWYGAGAFAGGLLLGSIIAGPLYPPAPVYVFPAPRVVHANPPVYVPGQAYAYPDPEQNQASLGQWVEVPGQWVNGRWVPGHKAWVPAE